ncbi:MAG: 30S ribosomal protein S17 [Candidatus Berkelbacteria bacterium]|nr:30S ribosomal protein S17 [Candidatus Berkelbacteria bacterium]
MKNIIGKVVTDKMQNSRMVEITELRRHPIYLRSYQKSRKIMAHDKENTTKIGDMVEIKSVRPISKNKAWEITRIIK